MSPEASAEPGIWRTSKAEYLRGMMDVFNDPFVDMITIMKSAQTGGTEVLNNIVGYIIDQDPGPILLLQPTLAMAHVYSKDRLAPMLRDTPVLQGKVKNVKSRDSGNTLLHKSFPGGHISLGGANSAASLASRPIRYLLCDEVDRYPFSAGTEGDPIKLASMRTLRFSNRKIVLVSTPTIKGFSRIERSWELSDQRRYNVPCLHCGVLQYLTFGRVGEIGGLKWQKLENGRPDLDTIEYECVACPGRMAERFLHRMVMEGKWVPTYPERRKHAGFHINELYSTLSMAA